MEPWEPAWDDAVRRAATRMGVYDLRFEARKSFTRGWSHALGLQRLLHRRGTRRVLGLSGDDWPMPWWIGNRRRLSRAHVVLKVINATDATVYLLGNRPEIPIVHLLRHPGGMLNSWLNRFAPRRDDQQLLQNQRNILKRLVLEAPGRQDLIDSPDTMPLWEAKLWSWRFAQERAIEVGAAHSAYACVIYEDLVRDTTATLQEAYRHLGLEWSAQLEEGVARLTQGSGEIAAKWRDRLTDDQQQCVARVLNETPLAELWKDHDPGA